jgi:Eukaryotic protein of unknown function (DUF829)
MPLAVEVTSKLVENPRTVAIVLGHLGATRETLECYSQLYNTRQCSVVAATSPVQRFMLNQSLQPTARLVLQQTHLAIKDTPSSVPIVVHAFSNGGAFILEQMEQILQQEDHVENNQDVQQPQDQDDECDLKLIAARMKQGYQFFDSCPCYIRMAWDWEHLNDSFPNPSWPFIGRYSYTAVAACSLTIWCTVTLSWHRPRHFWNHMIHSSTCMHQIYMYTTCDMASDAAAVDRLVQQRRKVHGESVFDCTVYRFEDSDHCRLLQDHPEEYEKAVDDALQAAIERSSSSKNATATATTTTSKTTPT